MALRPSLLASRPAGRRVFPREVLSVKSVFSAPFVVSIAAADLPLPAAPLSGHCLPTARVVRSAACLPVRSVCDPAVELVRPDRLVFGVSLVLPVDPAAYTAWVASGLSVAPWLSGLLAVGSGLSVLVQPVGGDSGVLVFCAPAHPQELRFAFLANAPAPGVDPLPAGCAGVAVCDDIACGFCRQVVVARVLANALVLADGRRFYRRALGDPGSGSFVYGSGSFDRIYPWSFVAAAGLAVAGR